MSETFDTATGLETGYGNARLDPFRSLRAHFGMLLGVDDFETIDAYHRGKMWLHSAWLHRAGSIWGLDVQIDVEHNEIRVTRGLAVDALGRELHLDYDACVNIGEWFLKHREEFDFDDSADTIQLDAHVVIQFKECLTRQVPALTETCDGSGQTTAYSRVEETVELLLRPGLAPVQNVPYHRLRLFFGLEEPLHEDPDDPDSPIVAADAEVLSERERIDGLPPDQQAPECLQVFRRFAALDGIDLHPATTMDGQNYSLFPNAPPAPLVLANLNQLVLERTDGGRRLAESDPGTVDVSVRPTHVATSTIQELLCGHCHAASESGGDSPESDTEPGDAESPESTTEPTETDPPEPEPAEPTAPAALPVAAEARSAGPADGPRIDPDSIQLKLNGARPQITFTVSKALHPASVDKQAVSVSVFHNKEGWQPVKIRQINFQQAAKQVLIRPFQVPEGHLVRLIVRGTGPAPMLDTNLVPLAGSLAGPPADEHNGHDFVLMLKRS